MNEKYFEANRDSWNKRAQVHKDSDFYALDSFKAGKTALNQLELSEMGNVQGKKLIHLQCHFGMDTLSWAREGADVTGIDFSPQAIEIANEIKDELNIPATFICSNVYDLTQHHKLKNAFDIVFTSYGVIGWLPDLEKWAETIVFLLKPGGTFYMAEFHPVVWMMDENFEYIKYFYHNQEIIEEDLTGTYTDRNAPITHKNYSWNHSISEVLNALIHHGLTINHFNEFNYSVHNCFNNTVKGNDGYWRIKGIENKIPMMYSVKAIYAP
ncbi:MAG: methyltransferase domain-containing protein [Bacteroidetes bacterium]|nr:methyltransferase domain-containing protein [Bacteroidota bacterium]